MKKPKSYGQQIITKKKNIYPVNAQLRGYLAEYMREIELPVSYADLRHFNGSISIRDKKGRDTLWEAAMYTQTELEHVHDGLKKIYPFRRSLTSLSECVNASLDYFVASGLRVKV